MPAITLKQSTPPKKSGPRTTYAVRVAELEPGKWVANLAPDGAKPGVALGGATAKEAFQALVEFMFE